MNLSSCLGGSEMLLMFQFSAAGETSVFFGSLIINVATCSFKATDLMNVAVHQPDRNTRSRKP